MTKREELASYAHNAWSGWMQWMLSCSPSSEGELTVPKKLVERWTRQMKTSYEDLSEEEKESDRVEADKILTIIQQK